MLDPLVISPTRRTPSIRQRGQAMVEFSLVAMALLFLIFACLDGSLLIFSVGTGRFAAGEGARIAAERGNASGTDAEILDAVRKTALGTTTLAQVTEVDIYRLNEDSSGNLTTDYSHYNKYRLDGTVLQQTWPPTTRNVTSGSSDFAAVQVFFTYRWKSGIFAPAPPVSLNSLFEIRLEPQIY
jgi:Flp pilus assembly protein TadG